MRDGSCNARIGRMPSRIIAVDFDGTLCADEFPRIGKPNMELIKKLHSMHESGDKLILHTIRKDELLEKALNACESWGITFDETNDNLDEIVETFKTHPRKIFATIYVDVRTNTFMKFPHEII